MIATVAPKVTLSTELYSELFTQACRHAPHECCGAVVIERGLARVQPMRNIHQQPTHFYTAHPLDLLILAETMARRPEDVLLYGFYHSHPGTRAVPSRHDFTMLEQLHRQPAPQWQQAKMLIVGFQPLEIRTYQRSDGGYPCVDVYAPGFFEEEVTV